MPEVENRKIKTSFWTDTQKLYECDLRLKIANCKNRSEYINKAIAYYNGFLSTESNSNFLSEIITSTVAAVISLTEQRISRMQFKEAVELAKITKMIAPLCGLDENDLQKLHIDCVNEVKKINGTIIYEKAVSQYREEN